MKRTKHTRFPDAILCADLHLREDQPECRTDYFHHSLCNKLDYIRKLQKKYQCKVINAGDLFHHWKPSPLLISTALQLLPDEFYTIYGQHDLPQHNIGLAHKCGLNTLLAADRISLLSTCHWENVPTEPSLIIKGRKILVWHTMVYVGKIPFEGQRAHGVLRKYPQYDLILTGDNHKPFVYEDDDRLLVNPGSMMRTTAAQVDHKPRVYLWYADDNTVEPAYLPIEEGVISREHIERREERDERIEAFITKLDGDFEAGLSFEDNLKKFLRSNKVRKSVKNIIYKSIEQ